MDARQTIAKDFLEELPLWKLSCYGHRKGGGPCDLFGDASVEEARWKHYDVRGGGGRGGEQEEARWKHYDVSGGAGRARGGGGTGGLGARRRTREGWILTV